MTEMWVTSIRNSKVVTMLMHYSCVRDALERDDPEALEGYAEELHENEWTTDGVDTMIIDWDQRKCLNISQSLFDAREVMPKDFDIIYVNIVDYWKQLLGR